MVKAYKQTKKQKSPLFFFWHLERERSQIQVRILIALIFQNFIHFPETDSTGMCVCVCV
jgi:hypothetical protein